MNLCRLLALAAAFFFLVCWVVSIVSTSLTDWWVIAGNGSQGGWGAYPILFFGGGLYPDHLSQIAATGVHEGLWSSCLYTVCFPTNQYSGGCLGQLNVVRAFSIMTIIFGFVAFMLSVELVFETRGAATAAVVMGMLTVCCSVIPWSVYLGFLNQCGLPFVNRGSGWGLAVAALPLACLGLLPLLLWCCLCPPSAEPLLCCAEQQPMAMTAIPAPTPAAVVCSPGTGGSPDYFLGAAPMTYAGPGVF